MAPRWSAVATPLAVVAPFNSACTPEKTDATVEDTGSVDTQDTHPDSDSPTETDSETDTPPPDTAVDTEDTEPTVDTAACEPRDCSEENAPGLVSDGPMLGDIPRANAAVMIDTYTYTAPQLIPIDANGDGYLDLVTSQDDEYSQSEAKRPLIHGGFYLYLNPGTDTLNANLRDARYLGRDYDQAGCVMTNATGLDGTSTPALALSTCPYDREELYAASVVITPLHGCGCRSIYDQGVILLGMDTGGTSSDAFEATSLAVSDVNGDGQVDLVVANANTEADLGLRPLLYVRYGPVTEDGALLDSEVALTGEGLEPHHTHAETSLATADLSGDGIDDIVLGLPNDETRAYRGGLVAIISDPPAGGTVMLDSDPTLIVGYSSGGVSGEFGCAVSVGGDVDGDGYGDLLVGARRWSPNGSSGGAYLYYGPVLEDLPMELADAMLLGDGPGDRAGHDVALEGDLDGDGRNDIVVAADFAENSAATWPSPGVAYILYDAPEGTQALADADAQIFGGEDDAYFPKYLATGDLNGDGADDLLTAASHLPSDPPRPLSSLVGGGEALGPN